ncbi:hypothetical protein [Nocardia kruczakiae]|uniref:hypothetical protein n=1 Tax=Nocardia kruczakiae TaxID=261477 RepID=UPI0007A54871|nr:hypothetical protein [Nocardia kruczakiae]
MGTFGLPTKPKKQPNGRWRTTVRFYGASGSTQIERIGRSSDEASNRLAEARRAYKEQLGYHCITRSTKLIELAAELLSDLEADESYTAGQRGGL